jgi:hypothetical protein
MWYKFCGRQQVSGQCPSVHKQKGWLRMPTRNRWRRNPGKVAGVLFVICFLACGTSVIAQSKHNASSRFPSYEGLVMCGYQGWFRAESDGSGEGWSHYSNGGSLSTSSLHPDFWPDVSDYEKTYSTPLTNRDGTSAQVFSSWDESTTDVHFRWMQQYGIDGVFVQRFFNPLRTKRGREKSRVVLEHALKASQKYGRAIAVMYDLSGLRDQGEDCSAIIQDWKELVDDLKITSQGTNQTYLFHRGKPLVTIWGLGFPDRSYDIRKIGMDKVIDFLKNDPTYGGCSVMLGVPTYFRDLNVDTNPDPYLHTLIESADVVMPWTVQRFTPLLHQFDVNRYEEHIKADLAWCAERHVDYAPCVSPGFSWHNMHYRNNDNDAVYPLNQIPRQKGRFYWSEISSAVRAKAKMLYVAMFDEMDEGTAIFKCSNNPPGGVQLCDYEGLPTDHYLWLTGQAGKMLRNEIPFSTRAPAREAIVAAPMDLGKKAVVRNE